MLPSSTVWSSGKTVKLLIRMSPRSQTMMMMTVTQMRVLRMMTPQPHRSLTTQRCQTMTRMVIQGSVRVVVSPPGVHHTHRVATSPCQDHSGLSAAGCASPVQSWLSGSLCFQGLSRLFHAVSFSGRKQYLQKRSSATQRPRSAGAAYTCYFTGGPCPTP